MLHRSSVLITLILDNITFKNSVLYIKMSDFFRYPRDGTTYFLCSLVLTF